MKSWQPVSLTKWYESRSDSYFWIHGFWNKNHFNIQVALPTWQANRLPGFHFEKPLMKPCLLSEQLTAKLLKYFFWSYVPSTLQNVKQMPHKCFNINYWHWANIWQTKILEIISFTFCGSTSKQVLLQYLIP